MGNRYTLYDNKNGTTSRYTTFEWYLAFIVMFLMGAIFGISIGGM